ncbi:GNAT family N-acetyltransferase [Streptomyces sp. NPDC059567]|uniref:GNAT family N-acetyltransferase n=1 Tax=Streptomyces sp. NPDC059567 TaxID=3346867 RepID=UPI003696CD2F
MSLIVPRLAAGAFELRRWERADLPLLEEASTDAYIPLVTTVPPVYSETEGEAFVRRQWARAENATGYPFVIVRRRDARAVGMIGLWLRELPEGRATLGYWIAPSCRGEGAAAAALTAVTAWAFDELGIPRLQLLAEPWNEASIRTAERAGYVREGVLRSWQEVGGERRDMVMYGQVRRPPG